MPYRRLPNTDAARLRALRKAYELGKEIPPFKLAFSQSTLHELNSFLPSFEKALFEYKQAYANQVDRNKDYLPDLKKAKLYISHYIQVLNMAIQRGEFPESERSFYGIKENESRIPPLITESDVIKWGEKLMHGEHLRALKSRTVITNPTIAVVKVRYEKFLDAYKFQKTLQKNLSRAQERIGTLRTVADEIIVKIWNEVEKKYQNLPENEKREKASVYGVVYVFRKNELKNMGNLSL